VGWGCRGWGGICRLLLALLLRLVVVLVVVINVARVPVLICHENLFRTLCCHSCASQQLGFSMDKDCAIDSDCLHKALERARARER